MRNFSTTTSPATSIASAHAGKTWSTRLLRRLWLRFATMQRIARERRELEALDDHLLKDVGLSRSVAYRETSRSWFDIPGNRIGPE